MRDIDAALPALRTRAAASVDLADGTAAPADGIAYGTFVYGVADADVHDHLDAAGDVGRRKPSHNTSASVTPYVRTWVVDGCEM